MDKIKFFDMFGGIGGFRLGLERASDRFQCSGYIEKDKFAVKSYNAIFGGNHEPTDITDIEAERFPEMDVLCAGFPCQSFSVAGRRRGFDDTRGTLFFEIARVAKRKLPEILLLENVKGLLNHADGETFGTILSTLDELGYDAEWQVLNSKHFGVPQNRERVFIVGHLGGLSGREVFPITGKAGADFGGDERKLKQVGNFREGKSSINNPETGRVPNWVDGPNDLNGTVRGGGRQSCKKKDNWDIVDDGVLIRKLTPLECWRLQGFPDWAFDRAEEVNSDTQLYKQAGNAVTVNVIEVLGERIEALF